MKPTSRSLCLTLLSVCALHSLAADMKEKGCFSSPDGFLEQGSYTWQSHLHCQEQCVKLNKPVMALGRGSDCSCGDLLPVESSKLSDSLCSKDCQGFPDEKCGGDDAWSIVLTGLNSNVGSAQESNDKDSESDNANSNSNPAPKAAQPASTTPTSPSTPSNSVAKPKSPNNAEDAAVQPDATKDKPPSTITRTGTTVVVTAPGQTQPVEVSAAETTKPSKGPNTAGIAAGVVAGVVVICALAGGLFFFLRRRKRRALEEDYQKNPVNPFETESESKPPTSSHSMTDSRLEPSVMMQRRQSDGSIADNQDYSRRILKVTNPDGT